MILKTFRVSDDMPVRNNKNDIVLEYLLDLLLQLSLDPKHNISSNPAFETFNGTFAPHRLRVVE
jgi:hypothetical protein